MSRPSLQPFLLWLGCVYAAWFALVGFGGHLATVLAHWPIAVAMAFGSYVAGSTPMGGGTVGFPVLVLLLDQPVTLGRDFSFAVQSVGMTSAAIFIGCRRQPVASRLLAWALLAALPAVPLAAVFLVPLVPALLVKLLFSVIWASFGVVHLLRLRELVQLSGTGLSTPGRDRTLGLALGLLGGATSALLGVSIEMLAYLVLVLVLRTDLRIAIPTAVTLMAAVSVLGLITNLVLGRVDPAVFPHWLAAVPIVVLGAPLGALVVQRIGRAPTLLVVSLLCVLQFAFTLWHQRVQGTTLLLALLGLLLFVLGFGALHRIGSAFERGQADQVSRPFMP